MNTAKYGVGADFGFRPATEQEQAEVYVREQLEKHWSPCCYRPASMCECLNPETSRIEGFDWLAVLEDAKPGNSYVFQHGSLVYKPENKIVMDFNLTTGQPATEADYKAFNDIVSV